MMNKPLYSFKAITMILSLGEIKRLVKEDNEKDVLFHTSYGFGDGNWNHEAEIFYEDGKYYICKDSIHFIEVMHDVNNPIPYGTFDGISDDTLFKIQSNYFECHNFKPMEFEGKKIW